MQLVNYTPIADDVLRPLLAEAARQVGAKTARVLVMVDWGHGGGKAWNNLYSYRVRVPGKTKRWPGYKGHRLAVCRKVLCCGAIKVTIPRVLAQAQPLDAAEKAYSTMLHEWAHIADGRSYTASDHRLPWVERPCEQVAVEATDNAKRRLTIRRQDLVLALGVALEEWAQSLAQKRAAGKVRRGRRVRISARTQALQDDASKTGDTLDAQAALDAAG